MPCMKRIYLILTFVISFACTSIRKEFIDEVHLQVQSRQEDHTIVTENDIKFLPECIQRYIKYIGFIGKPKFSSVHIQFGQSFHIQEPGAVPTDLTCEQYNFQAKPYRCFYMHGKIKGLPFEGKENYLEEQGNIKITLLSIFTIIDVKNKELNESALVTYLAECALLPSAFLNKNISWKTLDENSAQATITDNDNQVSGVFYFNNKGEMLRFVSNDRYYVTSENQYIKVPWVAELGDYQTVDSGLKLPSYLRATWKLPDSDFLYFNGYIKNIKFN
jgi:hypothetical protein